MIRTAVLLAVMTLLAAEAVRTFAAALTAHPREDTPQDTAEERPLPETDA